MTAAVNPSYADRGAVGSTPTEVAIPVVTATGIAKHFGGVQALQGVDLSLERTEIHAVVGENGAGKSTLMRILAGLEQPDAGLVEIDGEPLDPSPHAARAAGIALVHQELSLIPTLSVTENICLGDVPSRRGLVSWARMRQEAKAAMAHLAVELDVEETVDRLSLAQRQFVEIAKAVRQNPRVLILDEPTAALTPHETAELIALVKRLASGGTSILFVSHRIPEVFELCTTATVLRDGRKVGDFDLATTSRDELIQRMVGRDLAIAHPRARSGQAEVLLRVRDMEAPGLAGVSFELNAGEILGIGGLVGAGRSELLRAIARLDPVTSGSSEIDVDGRMVSITNYRQAIRAGIAFVPEERRIEGLSLALSTGSNLAAPSTSDLSRHGLLRRRDVRTFGRSAIERFGIKVQSPNTPAANLSGGNQQKIVLAKWMMRTVRVLLLDEPTRGVDVGAKAEVHALIRAAAEQGMGVVAVSSDLPELLEISDRVLVMKDGRLSGELGREDATEQAVMRLATGESAP
jgi:ABC-type sugar transport system ATPase subunit